MQQEDKIRKECKEEQFTQIYSYLNSSSDKEWWINVNKVDIKKADT